MSTYSTLRDRALGRVGCTGQTEAQTVAQAALEEAMRFVAFHVRVPSLIASATFTAPASPTLESNAIDLGASGLNILSVYSAPDRLYVKKDSSATKLGPSYEYYEYHIFQDLLNAGGGVRTGIFIDETKSELPNRAYTITPSNKLWCSNISEGNVGTFFFRKAPAAYSAGATPEILPAFDHILTNGAEMVLKEWLREPAELTSMWTIFENGLTNDLERYDREINGQHKRGHLKIHRSYRPQ